MIFMAFFLPFVRGCLDTEILVCFLGFRQAPAMLSIYYMRARLRAPGIPFAEEGDAGLADTAGTIFDETGYIWYDLSNCCRTAA